LWLAADHLLQVRMRGYSETYRRFYFGDVQAFTLQRTSRFLAWAISLGVPTALCGIAATAADGIGWVSFWAVLTALLALPLAIHLARGTTCRCTITTALETTQLVALSRVRTARKALEVLRTEIERVQGKATPGTTDVPGFPAPLAEPAVTSAANFAALPASGPPPLPSRRPLRWHQLLAGLLAGDAVLSSAQAISENSWLDAAGMLFAVAEVGLAMAAIIAQGHAGAIASRALRRFPWATLGYLGVLMAIVWVTGIVVGIQQGLAGTAPNNPFLATPSLGPQLPALHIAAVFGYLALALWGWLALRRAVPAGDTA
jgi:hypothetical protein